MINKRKKYFSKDIWAFKESILVSELVKKCGLIPNLNLLFTKLVIIYKNTFSVYTKYCVSLLFSFWAKTGCWASCGDVFLVFINSSLKKSLILQFRVKIFSHKTSTSFFITVQNNMVLCCPCNFDRWLIINLRYCGFRYKPNWVFVNQMWKCWMQVHASVPLWYLFSEVKSSVLKYMNTHRLFLSSGCIYFQAKT